MVSDHIDELNLPGAVVGDAASTRTRLLPRADGGGLSLGDTIIDSGHVLEIWDLTDIERCHCVEGTADVEDQDGRLVEQLAPGKVLTLDEGDPVRIRARKRVRLIFTFSRTGRAAVAWQDG